MAALTPSTTAPPAAAPATTRGYWLTLLLILLTLSADLSASSVFGWLAPLAAPDLGAAQTDVTAWVSAIGGLALPLSTILVADLVRRVDGRTLFFGGLGLSLLGAALAAAAPALPVLLLGRFCASVAVFLMLLTLLPAQMGRYPERINISLAFIAVALVGSSATGTLLGGFFEQLGAWRGYFVVILLLGLVALPLARALVPASPPAQPGAPVDWAALTLGPAAIVLVYEGLAQLSWHTWGAAEVWVPVALGLACLAALVLAEAVQRAPLFPVALLAHPVPALCLGVATVAATLNSALVAQLPVFLEQVRGLGEGAAAALLWPDLAATVAAAALLALTFRTRWFPRLVVLGILCFLGAAWSLAQIDAYTGDGAVLLLSGLLGLGYGTMLLPAQLTISFSERAAVARVPAGVIRRLAFVLLVRFTLASVGATPLAQWRGTRATLHAADLSWQVSAHTIARLVARYEQQGASAVAAQQRALSALERGLQTQATVLALQDVGALLVVILVGSGVVLGLGALSSTRRARAVVRRIW